MTIQLYCDRYDSKGWRQCHVSYLRSLYKATALRQRTTDKMLYEKGHSQAPCASRTASHTIWYRAYGSPRAEAFRPLWWRGWNLAKFSALASPGNAKYWGMQHELVPPPRRKLSNGGCNGKDENAEAQPPPVGESLRIHRCKVNAWSTPRAKIESFMQQSPAGLERWRSAPQHPWPPAAWCGASVLPCPDES